MTSQKRRPLFGVLVVIACLGFSAVAVAQETTAAKDWQSYFAGEVGKVSARSLSDLNNVTAESWPETKQLWREQLHEMLGLVPLPPRTPLQATTVGSISLDGVRIERLHYQSRPGLYVAANLYRPLDQSPPVEGWPAVLYVCGHARVTDNGRLLGNKTGYQHHGLWLARHGILCLTIDTIQLGEFHGEHHGTNRLGRWDWISRGYTPAGVEAWNAIRALDLLQSLPDVDGSKLAITGRSGGGAYSWFAAALDERIKVAVPVAGITDLQNHVVDGCVEGHCDCMYFVNYFGWDYAKLAALMAPRALLLANSDSDGIFPLDGVMRIQKPLSDLYAKLDAAKNFGTVITPGPHQDTQDLQVPAFRWLLKHLTGVEPIIDSAALKEVEPHELAVFETEIPTDERVGSVSEWFVPKEQSIAPKIESGAISAISLWRETWLPELQRLGVLEQNVSEAAADEANDNDEHAAFEVVASGTNSDRDWSILGTNQIPGLQILQIGQSNAKRSAVHLGIGTEVAWTEVGIANVFAQKALAQTLDRLPEHTHYFVRWRGNDWLAPDQTVKRNTNIVRRFYLLGKTPDQVALQDFLLATKFLMRERGETEWALSGSGRQAPLAALAAFVLQDAADSGEGTSAAPIKSLYLAKYPSDAQTAAALPGFLRVMDFRSLKAAAGQRFDCSEFELETASPDYLVDSSSQPQQANGMRIVEVLQDSAKVWLRATRWPLANLADLPAVEFEKPADGGSKKNVNPILPELGVDGLRFAVPGMAAELRVGYRARPDGRWNYSEWREVTGETDYSSIVTLEGLQPDTTYEVRTVARGLGQNNGESSLSGSFRTLPAADTLPTFRLAVGTCQDFNDRDGPHGFDMYRTMLDRETDAFIMAGDVVYYDALARSKQLAFYHWQRTYSLPTLVEFQRKVPTFFLKDDHDTYVNDSWPGNRFPWTGDFTFEDGQRIFIQQTGLPSPAYRTFRVGEDLQVWLMEGRDYRSPNNAPDDATKSIWGAEQKKWLQTTLKNSTAAFRVVVSPTPIVGPDRENKSDNHANRVFQTEGNEVRQFLASQPNTVTVCGDRHWQFHSIDPQTGLHEFSVGPASDRHAGGWKQSDFRPKMHQFLRVGGGYLEIELAGSPESRSLTLRHLDTRGVEQHHHVLVKSSEASE